MNIWIQDIFSDENLKAAYENNIKCFNKCQELLQDVLMINFVEKYLMRSIIILEDIEKVNQKTCEHYIKRNTHVLNGVHCDECVEKKINSKFNKSRDGKDEKFQEVSYKLYFPMPI